MALKGLKTLVLGVKAYDFDKDGEQVKGMKIIYLDEPENSEMVQGYMPISAPADFSVLENFYAKPFPGVFELDFRMRPDSRSGKPTLTVTSAQFVEQYPIELPS